MEDTKEPLAHTITNYFFQKCSAVVRKEDYDWVSEQLKELEEKAWKYDELGQPPLKQGLNNKM